MTALLHKPTSSKKRYRNDRRAEERERRLKQPWTAGSPPPVESPGIEVVKKLQDDPIAQRIKNWGQTAGWGRTNISPNNHQYTRGDGGSRPAERMQPPPPHHHHHSSSHHGAGSVPDRPGAGGVLAAPDHHKSKGEPGVSSSEHKHKKDKKRKSSSHSEERHVKKKSKDKDKDKERRHSPSPLHGKEPASAASVVSSGTALSAPPKKISKRSSSVSSDRSDQSTKSHRSSVDHKQSNHIGSSSKSSKSSSSSKSGGSSKSHQSNSHHQNPVSGSTTSNHHNATTSSHISQHGASSNKGAHGGKGGSSSSDTVDMNSESFMRDLLNVNSKSSSSNAKDATTRPINGLIKTTANSKKPTRLVLPSATKPTNTVPPSRHTNSERETDYKDVSVMLNEMTKPSVVEKLTAIQTPIKVDMKYEYPKPAPHLPSSSSSGKSSSKSNSKYEDAKDKQRLISGATSTNNNKLSPIKIPKHTNGVADDLRLSPSPSDSDSGSSSDSSSSGSSSSSSSSDSESDSDNEEVRPPPPLFSNFIPSPAPTNRYEDNNKAENWSLSELIHSSPDNIKPKLSAPPAASKPTTLSKSSTHNTKVNSSAASGDPPKRGRGRPKKTDVRKQEDPTYTPVKIPGKQPPEVSSSVTTDRKPRKKPGADGPTKKRGPGRPPKNKVPDPSSAALPSSLSSDESSNHTLFPSNSEPKPTVVPRLPLPGLVGGSGSACSGGLGEDEDVDVDVTGSPHSTPAKSTYQPLIKSEPTKKPNVVSGQSQFRQISWSKYSETPNGKLKIPAKNESILPKTEEISPVEDTHFNPLNHLSMTKSHRQADSNSIKPSAAQPISTDSINSNTNQGSSASSIGSSAGSKCSNITSLPFSIPLHKLRKAPTRIGHLSHLNNSASIKTETGMRVPPLPGVKTEASSPTTQNRKRSPLEQLLIIKSKRSKTEVKTPDDDCSPPFKDVNSFAPPGHKNMPRSSLLVPNYEDMDTSIIHTQARVLKGKAAEMDKEIKSFQNTDPKAVVERQLICIESLYNFLITGMGMETGNPKSLNTVRTYYKTTLDLATSLFGDILKESTHQPRSIAQCTQVLCNYILAHMKNKCYKLVKDQHIASSKRIQEQVNQRLSISPHITGLPGNSPAPSPASVASTSSVGSDSVRGASLPPSNATIGVPESLLRDMKDFMKQQALLSEAVDQWKMANLIRDHEPDNYDFFQLLESDLGYKSDYFLETKQFVHYINTACKRLQEKLANS